MAGALVIAALLAGIYDNDHFDRVTKLTPDNVESVIKETVDADKTLFMRIIASEGWGWWVKQSSAWNDATKLFENNTDVRFGDVNLAESRVTAAHGADFNPGMGGWPTHRYFNKETGYGGKPYEKKTSQKICDELGQTDAMVEYVCEAGSTALCSAATGEGCSEKEVAFTATWRAKAAEDPALIDAELERLGKIKAGGKMKPELKQWLSQRIALLKQLAKGIAAKDEL